MSKPEQWTQKTFAEVLRKMAREADDIAERVALSFQGGYSDFFDGKREAFLIAAALLDTPGEGCDLADGLSEADRRRLLP